MSNSVLSSDFQQMIANAHCHTAEVEKHYVEAYYGELHRPFTLLKPRISIDGNMWCVLYGENLQDGVAGFGKSPHEASLQFDLAWYKQLKQRAKT